jgi:hypothetical protein
MMAVLSLPPEVNICNVGLPGRTAADSLTLGTLLELGPSMGHKIRDSRLPYPL